MPGTVDVCCKLPGGLHLTVFRMEDSQELLQGGGTRVVKRAVADGRVTVRGIGRREDDPRIIGGYAVTRGVDADFWSRWLEQNATSDLVKSRLVFAAEKPAVLEAIRMSVDGKPTVVINGTNHTEVVDGAGITEGVDAAVLEKWMEIHAKSDWVTQGLIQKVEPAKLEDAKSKGMKPVAPPPVPASAATPPAPTERADVADLKAMKDSKVAPATPAAAPPP